MGKPPPPPVSKAAVTEVKAFGEAFDAAVSHIDGGVGASTPSGGHQAVLDTAGPVYANDLEMTGVYTGPYNQVNPEHVPPSLAHLSEAELRLKTMAHQALTPAAEPPAMAPAQPAMAMSTLIKAALAIGVLALSLLLASKFGLF